MLFLANPQYIAFIFVLLHSRLVTSFCFHPNGTSNPDPYHAPCSNDSSNSLSSICCATDRPNYIGGDLANGQTSDFCLANGLCQNRVVVKGQEITTYFREECTDKDWTEGKCPRYCIMGSDGNGNRQMTPCDGTWMSERWCCGDSDSCCLAGNESMIEVVSFIFGDSSTTVPSATPNLRVDSITTTSATPIPTSVSRPYFVFPSKSSSSSREQESDPVQHDGSSSPKSHIILGASIGGVLGLFSLVMIGICMCRRRNMKVLNDASTYTGGHSSFYERVN